jgi:hypothetical protein
MSYARFVVELYLFMYFPFLERRVFTIMLIDDERHNCGQLHKWWDHYTGLSIKDDHYLIPPIIWRVKLLVMRCKYKTGHRGLIQY